LEDFKEEEFKHLITDDIKLENFEILKVIGRGAFAKIYLVKKHIPGPDGIQFYALKVLKKKELYRKQQVHHTALER
jgi:serine/threonine protein kinase